MHKYANPAKFLEISGVVLPWAMAVTAVCFGLGLYYGLYASPADFQQGETVRIMYIHVPSAWMALGTYSSMAIAAFASLVWKHPLADLYAKGIAPVGAAFTALCLATGSLWGQPTWGTWWVWDARLTSVLILFFLYLGYMALVDAFDDETRGLKAGAILLLVGSVNLPIIKFSVDWWNTLHQPASISRIGTPAIDPSMLTPLLLMVAAFTGLFLCLAILRTKAQIQERKIRGLQMRLAGGAA